MSQLYSKIQNDKKWAYQDLPDKLIILQLLLLIPLNLLAHWVLELPYSSTVNGLFSSSNLNLYNLAEDLLSYFNILH